MKTLILSIIFLFSSFTIIAQAKEGTVEYQKNPQIAAIIELPYSPEVIEGAIKDYLLRNGKVASNDLKGFMSFRNSGSGSNDSLNNELHFKVERKSRKEKDASTVYLMLAVPTDKSGTGSKQLMTMDQGKSHLNRLVPAIHAYNLEEQIKDQNAAVTKAESKYKKLIEEAEDLEKKRQNIEKKIADNKSDQEKQVVEIQAQKQKLTMMVSDRK